MSSNTGTQTFGLDEDADVSDFMNRFSDPDTYVAPDEVNQRFDRFANAGHPEFQRAAGSYISQMDSSQFAQAAQNMEPQQRAGFAGGLLGSLQKMLGLDASSLGERIGLSSTDPQRMGAQDIGRLAGYAQQNAPGALQQTAREQPFLLKALGNPLVQGAIAVMAARYLANRSRQA
ncbi:MAG: hypothetical protein H0T92_19805 [Pyrinomonadaceae bacterium]|nr:hypothetical protein [Pyrinomonadaceae bacterium]